MEDQSLKCRLHKENAQTTSSEKLMDASNSAWKKIILIRNVRNWSKVKDTSWQSVLDNIPDIKPDDWRHHLSCYKAFSSVAKAKITSYENAQEKLAALKNNQDVENEQNYVRPVLRNDAPQVPKSNSGVILGGVCLYCRKYQRKVNQTQQKPTRVMVDKAEARIKALIKADEALNREYGNVDFPAKEVGYHQKCDEEQRYIPVDKSEKGRVYLSFFEFVSDHVIHHEKILFTNDAYQKFSELYNKSQCENDKIPTKRTVMTRLFTHFGEKIKCYFTKPCAVLYSCTINKDSIPFMIRNNQAQDLKYTALMTAARDIKDLIAELMKTADPLPVVLTAKHFREGQVAIPNWLMDFCLELVSKDPRSPTDKERRQAKSLASDMIYMSSHGYVKPAKQLSLSVGISSLTGCTTTRKVLHRFGQCISYTEEQGIMTEVAEACSARKYLVPDGLYRQPGLATSICFDNYDELLDSLFAGKQATHDTTGNVYQNKKPEGEAPPPEKATVNPNDQADGQAPPIKKRRTSYAGLENTEVCSSIIIASKYSTPTNFMHTIIEMNNT